MRPPSARVATAVVALLGAVALTACDVRTEVAIDVEESGAGRVTVAVGLDGDAVTRLPSLDTLVLTDDLAAAGWLVTGPDRDSDGFTWYRAGKPFETPEEATAIMAEISGPDGPFRDFVLGRERELGRTLLDVAGTVDLTGGLSTFSDAALAQSLEGQPLGEPVEQIEARLGERVAEVFSFELIVRMPGDVESNAPPADAEDDGDEAGSEAGEAEAGEAVWRPSLADTTPTAVQASSEVWRRNTVVATVVAVAGFVLLLVWMLSRLVTGRRRRRNATAATTPVHLPRPLPRRKPPQPPQAPRAPSQVAVTPHPYTCSHG